MGGKRIYLLLLVTVTIVVMAGCASVPLDYPKIPGSALQETNDTTLAAQSIAWRQDNPGGNGFYPLEHGLDAFGGRLVLMNLAEQSIDAQYFMMKPDEAGLVFSDVLIRAADRGVRVRLLLDDIFTTVDDNWFMLMNEHPNLEVRIFNPISRKGIYALNYVGHFDLANRRMHNKSMIFDNQAAIVGGRNIAEEYYQLDATGEFLDFDMLVAGPIVQDVSTEFDRYWNHALAIPIDALYDDMNTEQWSTIRKKFDTAIDGKDDSVYAQAINTNLIHDLNDHKIQPYLADARLVHDDPQKLLEPVADDQRVVANDLHELLLNADEEIIAFTPYFIPGKAGIATVNKITDNGVHLVLVTNSLATNNHTSAFSAYSAYRQPLLNAGVELWEARADAAKVVRKDGSTELAHLTLHTKGLIIDRRYIFVGSLNLDPRSIDINTEMGLIIDSRELATKLAVSSLRKIPEMTYRVEYGDDGKLQWRATIDGREVIARKEPQTTGWERFKAWFLKIAPEKQL